MSGAERRHPAHAELESLYQDLAEAVRQVSPRCELSGRCCNFATSGLKLYATELEVEYLIQREGRPPPAEPGTCPWYRGGLCHAREGRPLGCRVYFCDESKRLELEDLSAVYHRRLGKIHDQTGVSYRYSPFVDQVNPS